MTDQDQIERMFLVKRLVMQVQDSCDEAYVNALEARSIFTAPFIDELLKLTRSVDALRAKITVGQAFVRGSESRLEVRFVDK